MHKLTSMEAQRVIAVLEDALDKLNQLSYVPRAANLELLDKMAEAGANPVKSCLQAQWQVRKKGGPDGQFGGGEGKGSRPT